jgi:hypothetical protein
LPLGQDWQKARSSAVSLEGANNCLPCVLKSSHTFAQCVVLSLTSGVCRTVFCAIDSHWKGHTRTESSVLSFKLAYATLEGTKLCFALVTAVLSRDTVAVCTGFLALLWGHVRPSPLSWCGATFIGCRCWTGLCCRLGGSGRRKR